MIIIIEVRKPLGDPWLNSHIDWHYFALRHTNWRLWIRHIHRLRSLSIFFISHTDWADTTLKHDPWLNVQDTRTGRRAQHRSKWFDACNAIWSEIPQISDTIAETSTNGDLSTLPMIERPNHVTFLKERHEPETLTYITAVQPGSKMIHDTNQTS
jgi:hypothetical protein